MSNTDLYVIAAGRGSRMGTDFPKALVEVNDDEPCLTTTLRHVGLKFETVFVVTSSLASEYWHGYFQDLKVIHPELAGRVVNLPIRSGLGDGHATLQAMLAAERGVSAMLAQDVVVMWGDVFLQDGAIMDELLSMNPEGSGLLPAVRTENPYVALLVNERMQCLSADFSKFGELHAIGYHDQSVFRFSRPRLKASLWDLHRALWKNGRYISSGGELSLLYSFHQLYNAAEPAYVYETLYPTCSFNSVDDVVAIRRDRSVRTIPRFPAPLEPRDGGRSRNASPDLPLVDGPAVFPGDVSSA
jgi:molybdopterin-guanine dinucleotide biosynthesis protein A